MKTGCSFPLHDLHDIRLRLVSSFVMPCFHWDLSGFSGRIYIYIYINFGSTRSSLWRRQWNPLQYSCLENPMNWGAWKAAVHKVAEGQTGLNNFTFNFHFHSLEKKVATHSTVLAWRIPWVGKPDGLPSMGSHRVGHDWSDLAAAAAGLHCCSGLLYFQRAGAPL